MWRIIIVRSNSDFMLFIDTPAVILSFQQNKSSHISIKYNTPSTECINYSRGFYGEWNDLLDTILCSLNIPHKNIKNKIKELIQIRKKWKMFTPVIKQLYTACVMVGWSISICCHKNNMLYNSKSIVCKSPNDLYSKYIEKTSNLNINKDILNIIFEYSITIDEVIIICDCNTKHGECSRLYKFEIS